MHKRKNIRMVGSEGGIKKEREKKKRIKEIDRIKWKERPQNR